MEAFMCPHQVCQTQLRSLTFSHNLFSCHLNNRLALFNTQLPKYVGTLDNSKEYFEVWSLWKVCYGFFFFFLNKDLIPSLWKMFLKKWYEIKEHFYLKKKYVYCFLMVVKFYLRVRRRSFPILMVHLQRHYQTCIVQLSLSAVNNSQEKTISYS